MRVLTRLAYPPPEPGPGVWDIWLVGVSTPGTLVALDEKRHLDSMVKLLEPIRLSAVLVVVRHARCSFKGSPYSRLV